jgi:hypothetical protein
MLSINDKMNDGCDYVVNKSALMMLENTINDNHSLLQFTENLKSQKMSKIENAKSVMEYMLWDCKIHIINTIIKNKNDLHALQPVHLLALYLYTSSKSIFQYVNETLMNWSSNNKIYNEWKVFVSCLYQSLALIPNHEGELYRSIDMKYSDELSIGQTLTWNTFGTCSSEWSSCTSQIEKKTGMIFIINSKHGKNISKYSKYPANNEFVFLPNTQFIIKSHYVASPIALGQANIRESTFKMRAQEYEHVANDKMTIMIYIEEKE